MNRDAIRGAALPETVLVLMATLALIFGIIQIAIIGFLQLTCDGAAFIAAHEYSLGNTSTYQVLAQGPFPQTGPVVIATNTPDPMATPSPFVAFTTGAGGASLIRPSHTQATVHILAPAGLLNVGVASLSKIDVHGSAIEPQNQLTNATYDIGGEGYGGAGNPTTFFGSNADTPMYFVSSHRMLICQTVQTPLSTPLTYGAGLTYTPPTISNFGLTCPLANQVVDSLGTAEFLDRDNWSRVFYSNTGDDYHGVLYTFPEMVCHQKEFAMVATQLFDSPNIVPSSATVLANPAIKTIYGWDVAFPYVAGANTGTAAWGQYPLHAVLPSPVTSC